MPERLVIALSTQIADLPDCRASGIRRSNLAACVLIAASANENEAKRRGKSR
jgi:hypothetical protein